MGKPNKMKKPKGFNGRKPRKLIRKEKRQEKKQRKQEYYVNRKKSGKFVLAQNKDDVEIMDKKNKSKKDNKIENKKSKKEFVDQNTKEVMKDKKDQQKLQKEMQKRRKKQLLEANVEEDRMIKRLEKDLKLNKRKTKTIPKSFETDGLDYLLEVCDPEKMKNVVSSEKQFTDGNDGFEEDFALITGKSNKSKSEKKSNVPKNENSDDEFSNEEMDEEFSDEDDFSDDEMSNDSDSENDYTKSKGSKNKDPFFSYEDDGDLEECKSKKKNKKVKFTENTNDVDFDSTDKLKNKPGNSDDEFSNVDMDEDNFSDDEMSNDLDSENDPFFTYEDEDIEEEKQSKQKNKKIKFEDESDISESDEKPAQKSKKQTKIKEKKAEIKKSQILLEDPNKNNPNNKKNKVKREDDLSQSDDEPPKKNRKQDKLIKQKSEKGKSVKKNKQENSSDDDFDENMFSDDFGGSEDETTDKRTNKNTNKNKIKNNDNEESNEEMSGREYEESKKDEIWEDIYGRKRNKDGEVITETTTGKYIPPALRVQNDSKRTEKLLRLKRQLKGLLNRLAESNMHSIATQIEDLYMKNSRNDMNETIMQLIFESLISPVITPERLLLEHVMLITILHANVGTEVGATFLLNVVKKFDEILQLDQEVENKQLDNVVHIIAQLYNFKVFHAQLLYQIIEKLAEKFEEKQVECILLILKNVGFSLRKDDPAALKQIILELQKKATTVSNDDSRVKFMLDILLAIKNNNVTKIPNYDTTYSEHLKKLLKGFIRKGNYVTQLNISLDDLLKADERGKWWVVGSAWTGMDDKKPDKEETKKTIPAYSQKLLELARKQRMNTDTRRNIFCIIMSAEDYLDAFEKLLHLGLKNQQDREIIHVILHCCLQEQTFNPYYAILAQKFCEYDRKYQMTIRCSIWDKLKALTNCSGQQLSNMAKLLTHLFIQQALPISTLKVIEFGDLDKITLRFMRQVLLGVLLHEDEESCLTVFTRVATSPKLKMFRDSLRLFIHHFLLRNLKEGVIEDDQKELLTKRAQMVEKSLINTDNKTQIY